MAYSPVDIEVVVSEASLEGMVRLGFTPHEIDIAVVSAVNRTLARIRTRTSALMRDHINLKKETIDPYLEVIKANFRSGGILRIRSGERIGLKYFGARQVAAGVSYQILKQGSRVTMKSAFGPLIPRLGNQVFKRAGKKRLPIRGPKKGPSIKGAFISAGLKPVVVLEAQEILNDEVRGRIEFALLKRMGRIGQRAA